MAAATSGLTVATASAVASTAAVTVAVKRDTRASISAGAAGAVVLVDIFLPLVTHLTCDPPEK